ncbi:EAL domain-containing protein [Vibrio owensii]|uniref:EAL domain-containing protein n=1 Tax=Vibrio owensii TaxID=696485 RepID=UPI0005972997|nr:EAL domain-containing protein [Vibrio owensii]
MNILIIEDDPIQALNLRIQLRDLGYVHVDTASNLQDVIEVTQRNTFDLVFCDIHLPDTDGISLLSEHLTKDIAKAVVIISIVDDSILQLTMGMCSQLGYRFVSALQKPLVSEALESVMQSHKASLQETQTPKNGVNLSELDIFESFEQNRFFSVYQPQFSFDSGQLVGLEALVRMEHPKYGIVSPLHFLPLVIKTGRMKDLYAVMLDKATSAVSALGGNVKLSLNVTQDLLESDLTVITTQICERNEFPLNKLTLELTEEQAYNSSHKALANIARLSIKGVDFSIDDFGTGYASLEKLVDLPFSELKIDRLFISRVKDSYRHQQLTMSAARLAQSLGLHCIAEGVEDVDTWELLKGLGVDTCQGFYTGKPMSISELLPLYQVAKAPDVNATEPLSVVVYVDRDPTRGSALQKLLSKELSDHNVLFLPKLEELNNVMRDLPVSMVVIDSGALYKTSEKDRIALSNAKSKVDSVALISEESETNNLIFKMPFLIKGGVITDTAKQISTFVLRSGKDEMSSGLLKLSEREREVAKLLLAGFSNKYIAYEFGISEKTVSTFKRRIFSKLQVKSIIELSGILKFDT